MSAFFDTLSMNLFNTASFSSYIEPITQLFAPQKRFNELESKVTSVSWNNRNTFTLRIKPNRKWKGFKAGQFVNLTVEKEGAYVTRCFSISSSTNAFEKSREIDITIRAQDQGAVTPWIAQHLRRGSKVYLSQATGDFQLHPSDHDKLFLAAGSGITPIISMLQDNEEASWLSKATLLFYVRSINDRLFIKELEALTTKGLNCQVIYTETNGRFNEQQLKQYCPAFEDHDIYICGPEGMIDAVKTLGEKYAVPEEQIFFERFGQASSISIDAESLPDEPIFIDYQSSLKKSQAIQPNEQKTLLEIAETEGLKPVAGCRMGVCHQCVCKKKQGRVYNTKTKQISDTGEEEIQLCLSVPLDHITLEL